MYIEVFLLDNSIMNYIILRMACAVRNCRVARWRLACAALLGAVYAAFAIQNQLLMLLPLKLSGAFVMALALPLKSVKCYVLNAIALLLAVFIAGGVAICTALCGAGRQELSALTVRTVLAAALLSCTLPWLLRRLFQRRRSEALCRLVLAYGGATYGLDALIDTGSALKEPVSGLPVIVVHCTELSRFARIPIPASTVCGSTLLLALRPDGVTLNGYPADALIAFSNSPLRDAQAIIPGIAVSANTIGGKSDA